MAAVDPNTVLAQAVRHLRAGDILGAERLCRQVLAADRRNDTATAILGQIATMTGRHREAVRLLTSCVNRSPAEVDYHLLLAEALATQGRHDDAISRYDKALSIQDDNPAGLAGKANVLVRKESWDAARALLEPFVSAGTEDAGMAVVYARIAAHGKDYGTAVEVASRHVGDRPSGEIGRTLWFEIGRSQERAGHYAEAFEAFTEANRLTPGRWDPAVASAEYDRIMAAFTAERLRSLPRPSGGTDLPVFIVGMPRSGSTLIEQIIDAHPEAHGAGEILDLPELVATISGRIGSTLPYPECVSDLDVQDVESLAKTYLDGLRRLARRATRICDKYLLNYEHLGLITVLCPGARIIHSRREPLDTCVSCYTNKFAPGTPAFTGDLRHLGLRYNDYLALMGHWRAVGIPMLEVDYERLVADQATVSRQIVEYCGLPWDDACLRFFESQRSVITLSRDQVSQPIYGTSVGRHERYAEQLRPLREVLESGLRGSAA